MKKNIVISPVGLKGREINERMKQLMGVAPINENTSSSKVELTKLGPDGKAYAIVRENHEYYIKTSNKTSGLVMEDFKYIGGLQNKKQEAYPSYAKAIKHLNLRFNSLSEAYNSDMEINTFVDDNLLNEDVAGFAQYTGNGFTNEGNLEDNTPLYEETEEETEEDVEMSEIEEAIDKMLEFDKPAMQNFTDQYGEKGKDIYYATANAQDRNPETFEKNEGMDEWVEEELHGNQDKIDMNHNDAQDFHMMRGMDEENMNQEPNPMSMPPQRPTLGTAKNFDEWITALDDASAKEILHSIYAELGAPVVNVAKKFAGFVGGPDVRDAINKHNGLSEETESVDDAIEEMDSILESLNSKKKV